MDEKFENVINRLEKTKIKTLDNFTEIHGLWIYPYYNEINPEGSRKLSALINFLQDQGIKGNTKIWLEYFWLGARGLNNTIKELIYSFFVSICCIPRRHI